VAALWICAAILISTAYSCCHRTCKCWNNHSRLLHTQLNSLCTCKIFFESASAVKSMPNKGKAIRVSLNMLSEIPSLPCRVDLQPATWQPSHGEAPSHPPCHNYRSQSSRNKRSREATAGVKCHHHAIQTMTDMQRQSPPSSHSVQCTGGVQFETMTHVYTMSQPTTLGSQHTGVPNPHLCHLQYTHI
jgi:hypothetical protein